MHLHLFIPRHLSGDLTQSTRHPALHRLLSLGTHTLHTDSLEAFACRKAGVLPTNDESETLDALPLAAISWHGENTAPASCETGFFLFADPVHMVLQRDSFSLASPVPLPLAVEEAAGFQAVLNTHFATDGLEFLCGASGHWYLHLQERPQILTFPPALALNRDIRAYLPQGADAGSWRHLLNEVQMLLFTHPLNQERESRGLPALNSLWFWGGGALPPQQLTTAQQISIHAASPLPCGLARLAGAQALAMPTTYENIDSGRTGWIFFDELHPAEDIWFSKAAAALRRGTLQSLDISIESDARLLHLTLRRRDLWKVWRRPLPLTAYFEREDDHCY